ncbi:COX15/CtaA family protein [Octadecabacter sp. 1_MG-2023]|uniref:heme A synthase n=1 Tax=unclassified Octadecabacter TaxID=196158 RepID=UPI001C090026|nr:MULTISPECIES: heme A synthase [unclassified Octadecabacter]MBU2993346.1 COX15/CtaA family protein [Octadecabacter sp. B2R22]MDO6733198.1 COX15/CtaA family protein [Octadecabacter sp. 1_MG-2023]
MAVKPRSIFEEVSDVQKPVAAPGGIDGKGKGARGGIRVWLMILFAMVVAMIAVGGLTRLTDSGLSITEWAPISGSVPPMSAEAWDAEFEAYKLIPEYTEQNAGMSLSEFKGIYWWEWGHRQLGRVIGLVWAVGFLWFFVRRQIPVGWTGRLVLIGALGGLQGAIGWWMVHSGLQAGMLDVASYRLATHLGLAFVILGFIAWYVFLLGRREADLMQARRSGEAKLFSMSTGLMHFAFLQILLGALVAGIDAGRAFPTWPLMGDGFFPPEPFQITPIWRNFFEDAGLVQFIHRMSGYLLLTFGVVVWLRGRKSANGQTRFAVNMVFAVLLIQMVIGIATALYSAPVHIAIVHQFTAILLWVAILRARYLARYPLPQSIKGT